MPKIGAKITVDTDAKKYWITKSSRTGELEKHTSKPSGYGDTLGAEYWGYAYEYRVLEWDGTSWQNKGEKSRSGLDEEGNPTEDSLDFSTPREAMEQAVQSFKAKEGSLGHYASSSAVPRTIEAEERGWGAAEISQKDFIYSEDDPKVISGAVKAGSPKTIEEIYTALDVKLPGITGSDLKNQIMDMAPKFQAVPKEELEFAKEARDEDIYALRGGAAEIGKMGQSVYGGGGAGMRGQIAGAGALGTKFEEAQRGYRESIYGLEKERGETYEAATADWIKGMGTPFKTPTDKAGIETDKTVTPWGEGFRGGGYVGRNKDNLEETFLGVLTQLPDAGGS